MGPISEVDMVIEIWFNLCEHVSVSVCCYTHRLICHVCVCNCVRANITYKCDVHISCERLTFTRASYIFVFNFFLLFSYMCICVWVQAQTYSMDCYFRQSWVDRRLAFSGAQTTLALSISMLAKIWKPDTYFYNGKQSYLHTITTPNKFVRLYQDGRVLYSSRWVHGGGVGWGVDGIYF